jgi:F-type H+-transporting ATPase subunit b
MQQLLLTTFASEGHSESGGLFSALGIDVRLLVLQLIAFLILVWALGKWVYPILIKAIDDRQAALEQGLKASQAAQKQAEESEKNIAKELQAARKQADDILSATHKEAAGIVAEAEVKAARRAENIVAEAKSDMQNQLQAAREALKSDTRKLVAQATEQIIELKLDPKTDAALVDSAIRRAEERK